MFHRRNSAQVTKERKKEKKKERKIERKKERKKHIQSDKAKEWVINACKIERESERERMCLSVCDRI